MKRLTILLIALFGLGISLHSQNFVGVGIGLSTSFYCDGYHQITGVLDGGPAARAGVRINECIIEVDGRDVLGLGIAELADLIRGPEGTTVKLKLKWDEIREVKVFRGIVDPAKLEQDIKGQQRIDYENRIAVISDNRRKEFEMLFQEEGVDYYGQVIEGIILLVEYAANNYAALSAFAVKDESRNNKYLLDDDFQKNHHLKGVVDIIPFGKKLFKGSVKRMESISYESVAMEFIHPFLRYRLSEVFALKGYYLSEFKDNPNDEFSSFFIRKLGDSGEFHNNPYIFVRFSTEYSLFSRIEFQVTIEAPYLKYFEDISNLGRRYGLDKQGPVNANLSQNKCLSGDCQNGKGKIRIDKGNGRIEHYEGGFYNGLANGPGIYTEPAEDGHRILEGLFFMGFRHGPFNGKYQKNSGGEVFFIEGFELDKSSSIKIVSGATIEPMKVWVDESPEQARALFDARFQNMKCISGDCENKSSMFEIYETANHTALLMTYEGEMQNGLAHGKGKVIMQVGDDGRGLSVYQGSFRNGEMNGNIYHSVNGNLFFQYIYQSGKQVSSEALVDMEELQNWNNAIQKRLQSLTFGSSSSEATEARHQKHYDLKTFPGILEALGDIYEGKGWRYSSGSYIERDPFTTSFIRGRAGRVYLLVFKSDTELYVYRKDHNQPYEQRSRSIFNMGSPIVHRYENEGFFLETRFQEYKLEDYIVLEFHGTSRQHAVTEHRFWRPGRGPAFLMVFEKIY